ncbi:hypothetical protein B0H11DRAFT_2196739 [Mycena galericulata]|nr:hypothetical protein B0H11DRAFT_2196739 [Mycena galericulata]
MPFRFERRVLRTCGSLKEKEKDGRRNDGGYHRCGGSGFDIPCADDIAREADLQLIKILGSQGEHGTSKRYLLATKRLRASTVIKFGEASLCPRLGLRLAPLIIWLACKSGIGRAIRGVIGGGALKPEETPGNALPVDYPSRTIGCSEKQARMAEKDQSGCVNAGAWGTDRAPVMQKPNGRQPDVLLRARWNAKGLVGLFIPLFEAERQKSVTHMASDLHEAAGLCEDPWVRVARPRRSSDTVYTPRRARPKKSGGRLQIVAPANRGFAGKPSKKIRWGLDSEMAETIHVLTWNVTHN